MLTLKKLCRGSTVLMCNMEIRKAVLFFFFFNSCSTGKLKWFCLHLMKDEGRKDLLLVKYNGMWISPTQNAVTHLQFDFFFLIRIKSHYKKKAIPCLKKCWHLARREWRGCSELKPEDMHFSREITHSMNSPACVNDKVIFPTWRFHPRDRKEGEHCRHLRRS